MRSRPAGSVRCLLSSAVEAGTIAAISEVGLEKDTCESRAVRREPSRRLPLSLAGCRDWEGWAPFADKRKQQPRKGRTRFGVPFTVSFACDERGREPRLGLAPGSGRRLGEPVVESAKAKPRAEAKSYLLKEKAASGSRSACPFPLRPAENLSEGRRSSPGGHRGWCPDLGGPAPSPTYRNFFLASF